MSRSDTKHARRPWLFRWVAACLASVSLTAATAQETVKPEGVVPKRFLLSGHSLTDDPFAGYLSAIGKSQGFDVDWNEQIVIGSPSRYRTRGDASRAGEWNGYSLGKNRNGSGLDILAELKKPTSKPFDTLIIAEGHKLVAQLIYNDAPRYLRHYHERMIEHNPATRTYQFESWEHLKDKAAPAPWIAVEQHATRVWRCVADRINISLAHERRADRVRTIPIGVALAHLVDAVSRGGLPEIKTVGNKTPLDQILPDGTHLGTLGRYFAALVTYATMTDQPVVTNWRPSGVSEQAAMALQRTAADFHKQRKATFTPLDLEGCRRFAVDTYCDAWNAYVTEDVQGNCRKFFARTTLAHGNNELPNPFVFEPEKDAQYWFPAPGN